MTIRFTIEQFDRCEHLNEVGGCTINGDCKSRTNDEREKRLCHNKIIEKKKKRDVIR